MITSCWNLKGEEHKHLDDGKRFTRMDIWVCQNNILFRKNESYIFRLNGLAINRQNYKNTKGGTFLSYFPSLHLFIVDVERVIAAPNHTQ